jgi:SWI/SNF-related matrix-associated actin-dependent regulator of chromatin subfamily A member 5
LIFQNVDETPDYTDSDTNPNTTASSVVGEPMFDGRKRRSEANQLRRSIFGKKHDRLGESKVGPASQVLLNAVMLTLSIGR